MIEEISRYSFFSRKRRSPRVKILTINCRSLRSEYKRCEFVSVIASHQPDIINATETHLNNEFCSAELNLPGYEIFRRDRNSGSPGGGVLIVVKNTLLATREPTLEEDSCEAVWGKIHIAGSRPLYNGCFYKKPDHHLEAVCGLDNAVSKITSSTCIPNILITGDFNLPDINWDLCDNENKYHIHNNPQYGTAINQALLDMVNHHSLSQCVQDPTRNSNIWYSPQTLTLLKAPPLTKA